MSASRSNERDEPGFDPEDHKASARRGWSDVADAWRRWWRTFEDGAQPLNDRLCELAGVAPGMRVLDVATGIGEPALTAARRVGAAGSVLATDLSPRMIELGAERARELGLGHVRFLEADAEALQLEPESFDAALSRWGLMLMPEPALAVMHVRDALRLGGRLAASVWCEPERVPFLALGREEAARELGVAPPPEGAPGPFRLADEGALAALLEEAGLVVEAVERRAVRFVFAAPEVYADFVMELSGQLARAVADAPPDARGRARAALVEAASARTEGGGAVVLDNEAWIAAGRR